jgi:hypothetical protein
MFERLDRSWRLYQASWRVLKEERQLLVLPLISVIAALAVCGAFALGALGLWAADGFSSARGHVPAMGYAMGFLFYVSMYFVMFFFNAALVGAALAHFDGRSTSVGSAMGMAGSKFGELLGYAVIAATVGMLLRFIQERVGFVGRIVVAFVGAGWTVATFLVVPVLVSQDVGPIDAVKESATILKRTWGETIAGRAGMSLAFFIIHLAVIIVGVALVVGAVATQNTALIVLAVGLVVIATMVVALVHTALSGIYAAAVYRFATGGGHAAGFDDDAMQAAFKRKG